MKKTGKLKKMHECLPDHLQEEYVYYVNGMQRYVRQNKT